MMIPITRKEKYINEIVGGGNTAPETPQTREELFFADILGEVVAPSPITRAEKYLAKIANKYSGELPEPVTRIERFLARAAGMDVTIPTPITREEMFWADYALIVEKELSGIPPLTFNAVAGSLKNYRIYGNTVDGESVGDLVTDSQSGHYGKYAIPVTNNSETANIYLDEPLRKVGDEAEYVDYAEQKQHRVRKNLCQINKANNAVISHAIEGQIYTFSLTADFSVGFRILKRNADSGSTEAVASAFNREGRVSATFTANENFDVYVNGFSAVDDKTFLNSVHDFMFEKGATASEYEPYIENTELDVTLPALPVLPGTNTLTVGTEVQPSNVYIKYEGAR